MSKEETRKSESKRFKADFEVQNILADTIDDFSRKVSELTKDREISLISANVVTKRLI